MCIGSWKGGGKEVKRNTGKTEKICSSLCSALPILSDSQVV